MAEVWSHNYGLNWRQKHRCGPVWNCIKTVSPCDAISILGRLFGCFPARPPFPSSCSDPNALHLCWRHQLSPRPATDRLPSAAPLPRSVPGFYKFGLQCRGSLDDRTLSFPRFLLATSHGGREVSMSYSLLRRRRVEHSFPAVAPRVFVP